ncbi:hypothetical protein JMK98_05985 [Pediococcus pentosaceus]|jgi:hypothetical protein|uniref:hypothetical protein n=1 Tax=Pediococcus pentosaceus TaxID=1255 RepID=UPI00196617E8|nr:hypothetical protein [Pediococcus pentosaceus]MBM9930028.1 hypothetical protein [Pediococcus pentosaceus]MCL3858932.1 hypothetical protein [Pediococcus pentosaceus]MDE3751825.1 hypothetical protein [Pediococcus pentosaceus]
MNNKNNQYDPQVVQNFFDNVYIDRGMIKWQGFFLSDHTVVIKRKRNDNKIFYEQKIPPRMKQGEIRLKVARAYEEQLLVEIQLNECNRDLLFENAIKSRIKGFSEDSVYLGDGKFVSISMMRSIRLADNGKG